MFGKPQRFGLVDSHLAPEMYVDIEIEKGLEYVLNSVKAPREEENDEKLDDNHYFSKGQSSFHTSI